jgi:hypothetical protein
LSVVFAPGDYEYIGKRGEEGDPRHTIKYWHLNLTSTEVTDNAMNMILKFEQLESLCLGDVRISTAAIEKLKQREPMRTDDRQLRWGYRPQKE